MTITKGERHSRLVGHRRLLVAGVACTAVLGGCSTLNSNFSQSADESTGNGNLWSHNRDFVKIDSSGASDDQTSLSITGPQVDAALGKLRVSWNNGTVEPVFSRKILAEISGPVARGLRHEKPGEDIVFAVTFKSVDPGIIKSLFTPRSITTGRIFYDGSKLNVIFGQMHDSIERQLLAGSADIPTAPGARKRRVSYGWQIRTASDYALHSKSRPDWVLIAPAAWRSVTSAPVSSNNRKTPTPSTPTPAAPASSNFYDTAKKRLDTLEKMRDNGIISQKEYAKERGRILDQLGSLPPQ